MDVDWCASELLSFAAAFPKVNLQLFHEEVNRVYRQEVGAHEDGFGDNEAMDDDHDDYEEDFDWPGAINRKQIDEKSKLS